MARCLVSAWLVLSLAAPGFALFGQDSALGTETERPVVVANAKKKVALPSKSYVEGLIARAQKYLDRSGPGRNPAKAVPLLNAAARAGDVGAMFLLADLYATGDGVAVDFARARRLLERAVAAGEVREGSRALGDLYRYASAEHRNPTEAEASYQRAVDLGDAGAMIALAEMLGSGEDIPTDFDRARSLLESAIAAGRDKQASRALGDLYRYAAAEHRDPARAEASYQRAVDLGDAGAMIALAEMLGSGDGVPVDFDRARTLLNAASRAGREKEASRALGDLYRYGAAEYRDPGKAEASYQRAVDLGDAGAMIALAEMLGSGDGVPVDFDRARTLFNAAFRAGREKEASRALGDLYRYAEAEHREAAKAEAAYQKAVELGDAGAMIALAEMLASGEGPVDFGRSRTLLEAAIAAGREREASRALGDLYRYAAAEHRDPAKAESAYRRAAELGDAGAMIAFGEMLASGEGIPVDFDRARTLLEAAIAAGREKEGSRALGDIYRYAAAAHRDPAKAEASYQKAADLGDAGAMIALAEMLASDGGIPVDFDRARTLLEAAIAAGREKEASRALGDLYRYAAAAHRDPAKADASYQKAADLGDGSAMIALADMLAFGDGIPTDFDRARILLEAAVGAEREKEASRALGDLYRWAEPPHRDPARAETAYQKAIDLGDAGAMISLAEMLGSGEGIPVNFDRALTLLQSAVAAGREKEGSRALGDLYRWAAPPHRDPARAEAAYRKAIDLGDAGAMISLAEMLGSGEGIPVNFDRARTLLESAIAAGREKEASRALADLYRYAAAEQRDPAKAEAIYQRAVDLGNFGAMIALAEMLSTGEGVAVDFDRAQQLLERAVAAGEVKGGSRALGDLYRHTATEHRDPVKAQSAYQKAIDLGDAGAMIALAEMLASGDGLPVDFDRARTLLESAIAAGREKEASRALGDLYRYTAAHREPVKAERAYQRAADLGDAGAMIALAEMLSTGEGIAVDFDRAQRLLKSAIATGREREGSRALGDLYRYATAEHRDPAKAEPAYQRAIDLGDPGAMIALAEMLASGDGIPVDFDRARTLLETAMAAGREKEASRALGELYRYATAEHRDPAKAEAAYKKAADLGDASAMIGLAEMLASGDGIPLDFDRARTLLETAMAAGREREGSRALGELYRYAVPEHRDPARAEAAYRKAADLGDASAMISLAEMLASGEGIPVNFDQARMLLEAAIGAGREKEAAKKLGDLYLSMPQPNKRRAWASYEIAARAGNPQANLAVGLLLVEQFQDQESRQQAIGHLRIAAQTLGPEEIAGAMMRIDSRALVAAVQQFLRSDGYRGPIDGVHGSRTEAAIGEYCREKEIGECEGTFISFDLLVSLLSSSG